MKKIRLTLALVIAPVMAFSATFTCGTNGVDNSCTPAGLRSLIQSANDGDIIQIAAGTHSWASASVEGVLVDKRITIRGGGICNDCGDTQTPTGNWPATFDIGTSQKQVLLIKIPNSGSNEIVRVTGCRFYGTTFFDYNWFNDRPGGFIMVSATNRATYRIDNNQFYNTASGDSFDAQSIQTHSYYSYGLIDNNHFFNTGNDGHIISIYRNGPSGYGHESMMEDLKYGSAEFVFVEDNSFYFSCNGSDYVFGPGVIDTFNGGRVVFRYNYVHNAMFTIHGHSGGFPSRPGHAQEIYNNRFEWQTCNPLDPAFATSLTWRGGTLLVYDNEMINYQYPVNIAYDRGEAYRFPPNGIDGGWNLCDPNRNVWDVVGPPLVCADQPGYAKSAGVTPATIQPQPLDPGRIWNNTGGPRGGCNGIEQHGGWICNKSIMPDPFDPEPVIANKRQILLVDDGIDYIFSQDASAALPGYTPYIYPHPLVSGSVDTEPPAKPRNLQLR